ncbi:MAG TPA: NAD(P)H-hydrate dehydratase [Egibacteraceae bacterium]|nr:NAD(P)H-hydrate dehydratase [Egibacteraceae bacterium]
MIPLYTPLQVRMMDERAFERGVAPLDLMERAAGHLARGIVGLAGAGYGLRAVLLCGNGNNGGDGLAAARRLLDAGAQPTVWLVGAESDLGADAAVQLRRWRETGGRVVAQSPEAALATADIAVDCLLGTGAAGPPRGRYGEAVAAINAFGGPVAACDIPTGVDADSGAVPGDAVRADLTVTLGGHKRGLHIWPARDYAGWIVLGDLGIVEPADEPVAQVVEARDLAWLLPPPPSEGEDKRDRGVVVILAGSADMIGAGVLAARGAMAAGAGLVTLATSERARPLIAPSIPEALTVALPDDDAAAAFDRLAAALEGADVLALGPGLGRAPATAELVRRVVREVALPLVVDADGINVFRGDADALADHAAPLLVLTPHIRELGRLVGETDVWDRRVELLPQWAKSWASVIVAKGPASIVAAPDGRVWVNSTGGPALATGGTGDVLTGMTAALLAQRGSPETVAAAVALHGLAGAAAADRLTARSVTALDVAAAIPTALSSVEQRR